MKVKGQMSKVKCFVGLSGGVDSSVSAALLRQAKPNNFEKLFGRPAPKGFRGFDVTGVFIKVWSPDFIRCTWKEDRLDAMRVCAKLGIPFKTLDLEKEYKKEVVDYMIREYKAGRTPNPDVMCNREIKFGAFFDWAIKQGADYVATGHYARVAPDATRVHKVESYKVHKDEDRLYKLDELYKLLTATDLSKEQSYFLWTLTQKQLARTLFPIGHLQKSEVRKLAKKFDLITATKKDSQGLCFIGKVDMKYFLKKFIKEKSGKVLNTKGEVIGSHDGAVFYTLGERHGFTITKKSPQDKRFYVMAKDLKKNTITVSNNHVLWDTGPKVEYKLINVNWIGYIPKAKAVCNVQIRYHGELLHAEITSQKGSKAIVKFKVPQLVALGQSIVFYHNEDCLGGGIVN